MQRCRWVNLDNPRYLVYHDERWGTPVHDDRELFRMLILEGFQAGLSWECVLNKEEAFDEAFEGFDVARVASFDEKKLDELRLNPKIIRNKAKILAAKNNAIAFVRIQKEHGSFDAYLWAHVDGTPIREWDKTSSPLSDLISKELKSYGMNFVGTTIIYSYLQAVGVINSHEPSCFRSGH